MTTRQGAALRRRRFISGFAALGAVSRIEADARIRPGVGSSGPVPQARPADLKITKVEVLRVTGKNKRGALYLKIHTDAGVTGLYGPIDVEAAVFVDRSFRRHLIGQDPLAHEALWDRIFRADRHSRGSHYIMGLSAIDNALWDLRGRLFGLPVYRLLGGSRRKVQAYASCLGFSQEPAALQSKARQ